LDLGVCVYVLGLEFYVLGLGLGFGLGFWV